MFEFLLRYGVCFEGIAGKRYLELHDGTSTFISKRESASRFNLYKAKDLARKYRGKVVYFDPSLISSCDQNDSFSGQRISLEP